MDINNYISSGIIEMYVMGLCSKEEMQELESLRIQYPELDKAITEFEIKYEKQLMNNAVMPSEKVDAKILQSFADMPKTENVKLINANTAKIIKPNWWRNVAAASIVLLLGSAVGMFLMLRKINHQQQEITGIKERSSITLPEADYAIMNNPAITPVAMMGVGSHSICRCTMYIDKNTGKAYVMIHHLAKRWTSSSSYQLWAVVNNKPVNVGIIDDSIRGRFVEMKNVPENSTAFMVSLEDVNTTTSTPSDDIYLQGKI